MRPMGRLTASLLVLAGLLPLGGALVAGPVAVFGSTGRVGRLVVDKLVQDGVEVKAVIRNETKASEVLPSTQHIETRALDLSSCSGEDLRKACEGCEGVVWCASGFTDMTTMESIDLKWMADLAGAFATSDPATDPSPRIVMLSSAGVTRPSWSEEKKEKLVGAADIPIIRLNPGDILNRKREAEEILRTSGVPYSIVRPTGLKFEGWPRGRPLLSQGDVAVGRTHPMDLADVLVSVLSEPSANGKTFEMFTLAGYPAPKSLQPLLETLRRDDAGPLDDTTVQANFDLLQQLLPGEEQDATKLEMGRTYEQIDRGEVEARARGAAPTEREKSVAAGVTAGAGAGSGSGGGVRQGTRRLIGRAFKRLLP